MNFPSYWNSFRSTHSLSIASPSGESQPPAKRSTVHGVLRSRTFWISLLPVALCLIAAGWLWRDRQGPLQWRQADAALERHDLVSAAAYLDQYLEARPNDEVALLVAARTARRLEQYSQAEALLIRCQEVGGVTDETRLEWDLFRVQQGELGAIHTRLRATIGPDHPDAPLVLEALARGYLYSDRLLDAMQACDLWIAKQPDHPWPWLWRGGIYERLANFDQALADYEQALELVPEDKDVRLSIGALLARGRRPAPATTHFEFVLNRFKDDQEALIGLAACHIEQGQPADAVPLLQRVLADDPTAARALVLLGSAALQQSDPGKAEAWLKQAVKQAPDDPEALHQLILALRVQDKHREADLLAPRLEEVRQDIERLDRLIRDMARDPENGSLRHEAGVIALRLGREELGVQWLQSALQAAGDHRATHAALAEHFAQRDDPRAEHHRRLAETP